MKKLLMNVFLGAAVCGFPLFAQQDAGTTGVITDHYAQPGSGFATGALPKSDLDSIVQAGIRSPSAVNRQPWHFTVVQNITLAKKMVPQAVDGNVIIVVSAADNGKPDQRITLDCALATESIYLAAQALGYGSRIYTGPIDSVNKNLKGELGLDSTYSAITLIRVGRTASEVDAVSAASSRKSAASLVTYK